MDLYKLFLHVCVSIIGGDCLNPETLYEKSVVGINDLLVSFYFFSIDNAGTRTEIFLNDSSVWKWVDTQCEGRCFSAVLPKVIYIRLTLNDLFTAIAHY